VDPVPNPLLLRKSGSAGNRTRISGSVTRNSDHELGDIESFDTAASNEPTVLAPVDFLRNVDGFLPDNI
jgi:hypothetical protein